MTIEPVIVGSPTVASPPSRNSMPAGTPGGSTGEPKTPPAGVGTAPAPTLPPLFPVTLRFDQETHRFFIEARDSAGLVVFQVPFKSAVPASSGAPSTTRGQRINSKA